MTDKQAERQKYRGQDGKYAEVFRCEICGKRIGVDYCSLPDCNETGFGLVVHEKCAIKYMGKEER